LNPTLEVEMRSKKIIGHPILSVRISMENPKKINRFSPRELSYFDQNGCLKKMTLKRLDYETKKYEIFFKLDLLVPSGVSKLCFWIKLYWISEKKFIKSLN
jgi:hypothetical protein